MRSPLFSVVIPTYDREGTIVRAVRSVLAQTLADLEVVVIDDGSRDGTGPALEALDDPRVRYHWQPNAGRCAARNRGAEVAFGTFLTFLDSDDEVLPNWLETFHRLLRGEDPTVACCGARLIRQRDQAHVWDETILVPRKLGPLHDDRVGLFLTGTFALKREAFLALGGYERELTFSENTDFSLRLLDHAERRGVRVAACPDPLLVIHNSRPIGNAATFRARLRSAELILERHGARFLEAAPTTYASYCAMAAVHAARLGEYPRARRHLAAAIRVAPLQPRNWGRLLAVSLAPRLARQYWLRQVPSDP